MISGTTKNGVKLYVTFTEDVFPNECGYYCEVYLDDSCCEEIDNFVIHPFELIDSKTPEDVAKEYIAEYDDMPILSNKFDTIYQLVNKTHEMLDDFYMEHFYFNEECCESDKVNMSDLMQRMDSVKELADFMSVRFSWGDE